MNVCKTCALLGYDTRQGPRWKWQRLAVAGCGWCGWLAGLLEFRSVMFKITFHREYVCLFLSLLALFACCCPFLLSCFLRLLCFALLCFALICFALLCFALLCFACLLASFAYYYSLFGRFVQWFVVSFVRFCLSRPFVR